MYVEIGNSSNKLDRALAMVPPEIINNEEEAISNDIETNEPLMNSIRPRTAPTFRNLGAPREEFGKVVQLYVLESWGDRDEVGLTGIQFLDGNFDPIETDLMEQQDCNILLGQNPMTDQAELMWCTSIEVHFPIPPCLTKNYIYA